MCEITISVEIKKEERSIYTEHTEGCTDTVNCGGWLPKAMLSRTRLIRVAIVHFVRVDCFDMASYCTFAFTCPR